MRRRALAFALAAGLGLLLGGMGQARAQSQQEPVFRGIQPKQTIIDAWQREEKTHVPGQGTASPSKPARESGGAGVPLSFLIVFEYNSSEFTDTARQQLDGVAEAIKSRELSGSRFKLEGHTDVIGSEAYNLDLSKRRAEAVLNYLVEAHGISRSLLSSVGVGERDLYDPANPTAEENRRVRIIRYAG
jgi:OmpA-OmpF porin, OOP family